MNRHFYRCADCLSVVAAETKIQPVQVPPSYYYSFGECGACGGAIEYMGEVRRDHLARTELRVPCDARCTGALGPHCECQCGGENHGSNRLVEVVVETGELPKLMVPPDARVKAETYRQLLERVQNAYRARYGRVTDWKRAGQYIGYEDYRLYCEGTRILRGIHAARELRTHAARNRKLNAILAEITSLATGRCA